MKREGEREIQREGEREKRNETVTVFYFRFFFTSAEHPLVLLRSATLRQFTH